MSELYSTKSEVRFDAQLAELQSNIDSIMGPNTQMRNDSIEALTDSLKNQNGFNAEDQISRNPKGNEEVRTKTLSLMDKGKNIHSP
jgi:hypothetical protein